MVKNVIKTGQRLWRDKAGATAIEYGLIAAGIAIVIIAGLAVLGPRLSTMFNEVAGNL